MSYLKIIRPLNCSITFLTILAAAFLASDQFKIEFLIAALIGFITAAGGNVINDYFDVEIDIINKPERPIPSGKISKSSALRLYSILLTCSYFLVAFLNLSSFIILIITHIILYFYSKTWKRIPFISNILISILTALAFIFGGSVSGNYSFVLIPALFAFAINLPREIIKDMEDAEGDSKNGIRTLPLIAGREKTEAIIITLISVLILLTTIPFFLNLFKIEYFLIIMLFVNPLLVYSIILLRKNTNIKNLNKISNILKFDMLLGLAAVFIGI